ncbi:MAG TPA: type IV pilin protein [Steroidobacter sp.]|uniref:type IV pilin protein n=1 Tax=Steroidobacter sp. TaxID=1978227 RepID=UPI002EDA3436
MRRRQVGITLIELLIAVAIVGILAAIAYPNYRQYALRGNRTEAKAALMQAAQELEKCYTRYGRYDDDRCTTFDALDDGVRDSEGRRYQISLNMDNTGRDDYELQAVPQGGQAVDSCGTLTLNATGRRSSATPDDPKCW